MKQLKTWFYAILLLTGLALTKTSSAQKGISCDSAKVLTYPINTTVTSYTNDVYWFKVTLDAGYYSIKLTNHPGVGKITKAGVYIGSCPSLTLTSTDTLASPTDTTFNINIHSTVNGTVFYVKLYNRGGGSTFDKTMATNLRIVGKVGFCPGEDAILVAQPINPVGTQTYTWLPGSGGNHASSYTVTPSSTVTPTTYTLIYNDADGTLTRIINVFPLPADMCNSCEYVRNGAFESFNNFTTSSVIGNLVNADFWQNLYQTCDYFHALQPSPAYSVPVNKFSTNTPAHSGNGYAGFGTFGPFGYREFFTSDPFKCPLAGGQAYRVSLFAMLGNRSQFATNNIGVFLSDWTISPSILTYTPHINSGLITDFTNWTNISGTYTGTGSGERYITIGNFFNDANTQTVTSTSPNNNGQGEAAYLIDDISITPLTPTLTASSFTVDCLAPTSTITLTALGASTLYTTWTDGVNTYSGSIITVPSPSVNMTYTCTVNLPCGSCTPLTQTITIISTGIFTPTITATASPTTICSGNTATLTASGANTYTWNPGALTGTSVTVSPTSTTIYTVTGTSSGCTNTKTVSVTVKTTPTVTVNNATICAGTSTVLTAGGATTYSWNTGATTNTISVSPSSTTGYTVTGTTTGCSNTKTVSVTVTANPTVSVSNATICLGTSTVLTASGATTYSWNTGVTTNTVSVSPSSNTIYTVTGTTTGCSNTKTVSVTVNAPTLTAVASPTAVCPSQTVTLTAGGAHTYTWNTGATSSVTTVSPTITTTYTVTGTSTVTGCSNTKTVTVTVNPPLGVTASTTICSGQSQTLTASGATTYSWSTSATTSSIVVTPSVTTTYTVSGTTGSCTATRTVQVAVAGQYCCQAANASIGTPTANTNVSNNSNGAGAVVDVLGTLTFTANSTMSNYILRMAPTATIHINPNVTVTFSNCTLYSCTDLWGGILIQDAVGTPGIVNVINSRIEDMYMGITHAGTHSLTTTSANNYINIQNSVLNKNYIAVHVRNSPVIKSTGAIHGLSVTGSTISSVYSATSPQTTLKTSTVYAYAYNNINNTSITYTNFPRGAVGIYLYNLAEAPVIIGDSTGTGGTNRFENLDFGVYAENASPKVFNNHFINITGSSKQFQSSFPPPPPPAGPAEIGVAVNAVITLTVNNPYWVRVGKVSSSTPTGGNPFPGGNKFENCGKGISITNYNEPVVKGNYFSTTTTSVPPSITPSELYSYYQSQNGVYIKDIKANATVVNNYILNHRSGIYTSHNIDASLGLSAFVKVENNAVVVSGSTGFCMQAVQVDQPASTTNLGTGLLTVKNNTIQNVYRGVWASNVKAGLQINDNPTISIDVANMYGITGTTSQINNYERTGIRLDNCVDGVVANNPNITGVGTIYSSYYIPVKGIWIRTSGGTNAQVNCNTISNMGRCMQFNNTSLNKVAKNVMNGTYQGFVLSASGQIGDQGRVTNTTHDNEWNGFTGGAAQYAETYTESSSTANSNSRFYVKSGSPYQPTQNYSSNGFPYNTGVNLGIDVQAGLSGESCLSLRVMGGESSSTESNAMRMASANDTTNTGLYESLASDTAFYEVYQNEMQYRNKQLVYELLNKQSIDTTKTLNEFYAANQNSNYQTLVDVNEAIAVQDYQTAQSMNSGLTTNNTIEAYQKRVNELLLKYLSYQSPVDTASSLIPVLHTYSAFNEEEIAELKTIANSCLDQYGNVVTQARVLVNNISNALVEFEENCNPEYNQRKGKAEVARPLSSVVKTKLYPNPNNGNMILEYDLGNAKEASMSLFDITGKLMTAYKLDSTKGTLLLNEQTLLNGIYFYHILVEGKTVKTDKIVIIK